MNNKINSAEFGILLLQQFDKNIFEKRVLNIIENVKSVRINIYIFYSEYSPLGRFEHEGYNIIYVNNKNIKNCYRDRGLQ